ncbi:cytochrome c oxidase assembly factor 1 family protein [Gillisia sp. M10.2A]|uniref:Cytochrome c oxidase assembly factor 1 family protein n=1 Tax=Gillisia lutea TaxID=2909668 RepID=A0ABS9EG53_9FLAO|nr:cytochrome c oxidase assembly factor Coa1 family protein [Gillisia lutea]MCF4101869.1 cytochrome c oxidase assembly factor 1 family protein [Gillisia lutea]
MSTFSISGHWWSKNWKWLVPLCVFVILLGGIILSSNVTGHVSDVTQAYADPDLYENALIKAEENERVKQVFGDIEPLDKMAILEGGLHYSKNYNTVETSVRVKGAKAQGVIDIAANRVDERWEYYIIRIRIKKPIEKKEIIDILSK